MLRRHMVEGDFEMEARHANRVKKEARSLVPISINSAGLAGTCAA